MLENSSNIVLGLVVLSVVLFVLMYYLLKSRINEELQIFCSKVCMIIFFVTFGTAIYITLSQGDLKWMASFMSAPFYCSSLYITIMTFFRREV